MFIYLFSEPLIAPRSHLSLCRLPASRRPIPTSGSVSILLRTYSFSLRTSTWPSVQVLSPPKPASRSTSPLLCCGSGLNLRGTSKSWWSQRRLAGRSCEILRIRYLLFYIPLFLSYSYDWTSHSIAVFIDSLCIEHYFGIYCLLKSFPVSLFLPLALASICLQSLLFEPLEGFDFFDVHLVNF